MHYATLTEPLKNDRWNLAAGKWLMEDVSSFELGTAAKRGTVKLEPFTKFPRPVVERLLLVMNGGYGDALMLVPALRALKAKRPEIQLTISCRQRIHCVFDGLPFAPALADYPISSESVALFDDVITTEHVQEDSDEGRTVPAVDIKSRILGVGPLVGAERRAEYAVSPDESAWAASTFPPRNGLKRIGIQLQASSPTRTYHPKRAGEVMQRLYDAGHELFIFGTPGSLPDPAVPERIRSRVKNLTALNLDFRQSAAVMQTCECLWCPDSSMVHVAGALGIKCVAVFGSTHWKLRTADYPSVFVLQGHGPCSPCWYHPKGSEIWPKGQICEKTGFCQPLNNIAPEQIVAKIEKQLAKI